MSDRTFTVQGVPLSIAPDVPLHSLAQDIGCITDVVADLAAIGAQGSDCEENLFHAIAYLTRIASAFATEIEVRTPRPEREEVEQV
jgi:hypothetical protein